MTALAVPKAPITRRKKHKDFGRILVERITDALSEGKGLITKAQLLEALTDQGIQKSDSRIQEVLEALEEIPESQGLTQEQLLGAIRKNCRIIEKSITGNLVIPDFKTFSADCREIFAEVREARSGKVADYIPQLGRVNPEHYAVSICTVDGQRLSLGDSGTPFCVQSVSKPISYCLALEEHGEGVVHKHVGREPSGRGFNELTLNNDGLPHNPMINAGAIMCASLIRADLDGADRFDYVLNKWEAMSGGFRPGFNNAVYQSERQTADRNFALGYFIKEKRVFPENTDLLSTLEFYFQCCSIEMNTDSMATVAATLAGAGVCPTTGNQVLKENTVKHCLSLMCSSGMYDFSGEFAFNVGLPAKSGVSGAVLLVVPNVMGITIWSPRLDQLGNSVRGIEFAKTLVSRFNFHNYDSLLRHPNKKDPRLRKNQEKCDSVVPLCWAASQGDLHEIKHFIAMGIRLDVSDYDGRTPLHLAASNGHLEVVNYLIAKEVPLNPVDRWGGTPLDDAYRGGHKAVITQLEAHGAKRYKSV